MKQLMRIITLLTLIISVDVSAAQGDSLPDTAFISGVIGHAQGNILSCEARSAADWAAYWGVSISESEFQDALPRADNPDLGFVGDSNDPWGRIPPHGYGVHAGPVAETLREFGLNAYAHRDLGWDDLREEISAGHPVIVWIIGQMWDGTPVEYQAPDGSTAIVATYEHTMILVGYSQDTVWVVDAYSGNLQNYWLTTFLKSWSVLGNMAVFGSFESPEEQGTATEDNGSTYTVESGDFLEALAERFNTTWQELAELNSISWPYTIFPGQVLQLPGKELSPVAQNESQPASSEAPLVVMHTFTTYLPTLYCDNNPTTRLSNPAFLSISASPNASSELNSVWLTSLCNRIGLDCPQIARLNGFQLRIALHRFR